MNGHDSEWHEKNQVHLAAWVAVMREVLRRHVRRARGESDDPTAEVDARARAAAAADAMAAPSAVDTLRSSFGLTEFERDVLLLAAAPELSADFSSDLAAAQGDDQRPYVTFGLALAALPGAHWSAAAARASLRRWRMVELLPGDLLTTSPLRIDERILHYLAGAPDSDARLAGIVSPVRGHDPLPESYEGVASRIVEVWSGSSSESAWPVVEVSSSDPGETRHLVAHACEMSGLGLFYTRGSDIPNVPVERDAFTVLWERESVLARAALLVDLSETDGSEVLRTAVACIEGMSCPVVVATREPVSMRNRPVARVHIEPPGIGERREWWRSTLGPLASELNGTVDTVISQFRLGAQGVRAAAADVVGRAATIAPDERRSEVLPRALWDACRTQARQGLDGLAERIVPMAAWDDLVLAETQRRVLREIAVHVRHRVRVYESWGFADKSARGLGISALFSGPSGTGKTMAAEVLANDLRLDLFRIDLSQVVSKYIGETEKNLKRVFDAAEGGGSILLFDEADALFGKRSEIKDSHDRYANIEVSYLLQRMEAYRGLAILTTNMKAAMDHAFLRRIRFVIQFSFPEMPQREEIWRGVFPEAAPVGDLDWATLSRLSVAGGNIRNIAMNAAFLAAADESPVTMSHILRATQGEYAKLERPLTDTETRGWR